MRILLLLLLMLSSVAQAKDSACETKLLRRPAEFRAMASKILKLPWVGGRKPSLSGLASNLQFRDLSWKVANAFDSGHLVNFFDVAPKLSQASEIQPIDEATVKLRWDFLDGNRLLIRVSKKMSETDLKLVEESKATEPYREVGQFRYHYRDENGQPRFKGSNLLFGRAHFLSFGGPFPQIAREIRDGIESLAKKNIVVESVELIHTHHHDSFMMKSGASEHLYYAPLSTRGLRSDQAAAEQIAKLVPVPFGVTAILGLEPEDLTLMSYWPSDTAKH